jgi:cytochrome c biogenesis protein CcmG/thiol:disulfide interchange protein DsbE
MAIARKEIILVLAGLSIGVGLGVLILYGFNLNTSLFEGNNNKPGGVTVPEQNEIAPDFTLKSLMGETIHLGDYRGKSVLLNFWATWCVPCQEEMPLIQSRYEQYRSNLVVLAVNFDEPAVDVQNFTKRLHISFDVLLDPGGKAQRLYRVRGYPSTFFIDTQGIIRVYHIGSMTADQLDSYLKMVNIGVDP